MIPAVTKPTVSKPPKMPEFFRGVFFGAAGVGKTHLLGTVGKGKKILVLDVEGGAVTYSSPPYLADEQATEPDNIDVIEFPTEGPDAITKPHELAHKVESTFDYLIRTQNADGYHLVVVDSLTELQARFISQHTANDPRQAYGDWAKAIHAIVLKAKATSAHVLFTSRPDVRDDEATGQTIVRADISPKAWKEVSGLFDAVAYYEARTQGARTNRTLDFTHGTRFQAKNRYGLTTVANPTMAEILEVVQQKTTSAAAPRSATATPAPRRVAPAPRAAAAARQ